MKSARPKVLHNLAGKPMLQHVIDVGRVLSPTQTIVVIGHQSEQVRNSLDGQIIDFVMQTKQLGTGHAVSQCLDKLESGNDVLVLFGDVPMIQLPTLEAFLANGVLSDINVLSFLPDNPKGYGRIVRDQNKNVCAIVEEKDASRDQREIQESNSGIIFIKGDKVSELLNKLDNDNAQGEYYLTDVVKHAVNSGYKVSATICEDANEVNGVNNQSQLAEVEKLYRSRQADKLMSEGVKLYDPERIDVRGSLKVGQDVEIDINCIFEGDVSLGNGVKIGANCIIRQSQIGDNCEIKPMTSIDSATLSERVSIGPFARIRPGTKCSNDVKIGNFVETKKAQIGQGSKISHLSYIGDTEMGKDVNIGAGTITCNYDGVNKFKTIIEDDVFVGSDTQLVAPVTIAKGATIGAGSTITKNAPEDKLTLTRSKQLTVSGWSRPEKIKE